MSQPSCDCLWLKCRLLYNEQQQRNIFMLAASNTNLERNAVVSQMRQSVPPTPLLVFVPAVMMKLGSVIGFIIK
jgi:hypothetical protein